MFACGKDCLTPKARVIQIIGIDHPALEGGILLRAIKLLSLLKIPNLPP